MGKRAKIASKTAHIMYKTAEKWLYSAIHFDLGGILKLPSVCEILA